MTNLSINGQIMTVLTKNYENKETVYLQFMCESEAKGIEILKVKITNDQDIQVVKKGDLVSVPISIASINGNLYYSQTDKLKILKH